ncbi:chorismate-binding protein [bacterium]|nr:chorismate-binding protein [bacterium]
MAVKKKNLALCYLPGEQKVKTFQPDHIEVFQDIEKYWMKRKGLVFYPFDRTKPAYFFANDGSKETAREFDLSANEELTQAEYETSVFLAQEEMSHGQLSKVVLARNKILPRDKMPEQVFKNAVEEFPEAYCYYVDLGMETWVGASPELLIEYTNGKLKTMALAGTKSLEEDFSEKEQKEQAMVEEFVEEKLNLLNLDYKKSKKDVLFQGNIKHLKTGYTVTCSATEALEVLKHLQPTSAVCGLPREESFHFIQTYETINRSFYSGVTGILEEDRALFFVNLRCLRFQESRIELFAGAGITKDSKPSEEWAETERKLETIEQMLG